MGEIATHDDMVDLGCQQALAKRRGRSFRSRREAEVKVREVRERERSHAGTLSVLGNTNVTDLQTLE
jgi:hypothetical protein